MGAFVDPVRVGNANLAWGSGFRCLCFLLALQPDNVEVLYVLWRAGGPVGDAGAAEVRAVVVLRGVVPLFDLEEVLSQELERVLVELYIARYNRPKLKRLTTHLRERDAAPLAFGCRKTPPGMTEGPRPEKEEKRIGGLRRCEVGPLDAC